MTLLGWAVVILAIGTLMLGFGGAFFDLAHRLVLAGGEFLLWASALIGS